MEKLGINAELCDDGIEEFGLKIIGELFDDEDVNLSEVEQAFDVFDQNKDGFIEARELQRILSCLGLGKDLMECEEMINAIDQNGDELIDRNEFFRIMEQCFGWNFLHMLAILISVAFTSYLIFHVLSMIFHF